LAHLANFLQLIDNNFKDIYLKFVSLRNNIKMWCGSKVKTMVYYFVRETWRWRLL